MQQASEPGGVSKAVCLEVYRLGYNMYPHHQHKNAASTTTRLNPSSFTPTFIPVISFPPTHFWNVRHMSGSALLGRTRLWSLREGGLEEAGQVDGAFRDISPRDVSADGSFAY